MCDYQLSTKEKEVEEKNWLCSGLEQKHPANPLWKGNSGICVTIPQGMVAGKAEKTFIKKKHWARNMLCPFEL